MGDTSFGMRLRMARERAGLKQSDVCETLGIQKVQTLSAYERGVNNPPIEVLKELSLQYGVSVDSLLFGENNLPAPKKTTEEYVRLLVEAAVHLDMEFVVKEDALGVNTKYYLDMNSLGFQDFGQFVSRWSTLRTLAENGTLSKEEYASVLLQRLGQLKLVPRER